jgi:endonuclease/exonuclease/phosphatase family metal-dependent hydrolase
MTNQTTILSYNILEGLQQSEIQIAVFVEWVTNLNPDIIFYQELNGFSEESFAKLAARCRHPFAIKMKEDGYRMGISSKYEITNIERVTKDMRLGYIYAKIQDYHVFAVHLDPFTEEERVKEIHKTLAHARALPDNSPIMIVGDFNALAESDLAAYSDPNFTFNMAAVNSKFTFDFTAINTMREAGYYDAYTLFHSDFKRSFPTAKRIMPGDQGRRIDYAFLSPELKEKCVSAEIIHDAVTRYLSDHYPLVVKLES